LAQKKIDKFVLKYEKQQSETAAGERGGPAITKQLLDEQGRAITNWKQLRTAIWAKSLIELLLVHDAATQQRWTKCKPAPESEAPRGGNNIEPNKKLPEYVAQNSDWQMLLALGEDGSTGVHPLTKQSCDFKVTTKWIKRTATTCESRNKSLFAHGYQMITKAQ
jgi:hypothetical protein